jgi:GNAT superfamily N-acetyltransferase
LTDISLVTTGKGDLCREFMNELPEWFDQPEANAACADIVEELPLFACQRDGIVAGLVALKQHPPSAMEILLIAVRRQFHRRGVGHRLVEAAADCAWDAGCRLLTVKTLAPRDRDEPQYAATRAFYEGSGFIAAEIFPKLWHEDFPCLFLVKPLDRRIG